MKYHVIAAKHVSGYLIHLTFRDGTAGEIDLSAELTGPVFEPLREAEAFKRFSVHPEFHTLVWPNGADLAPEFLYENLKMSIMPLQPTAEKRGSSPAESLGPKGAEDERTG